MVQDCPSKPAVAAVPYGPAARGGRIAASFGPQGLGAAADAVVAGTAAQLRRAVRRRAWRPAIARRAKPYDRRGSWKRLFHMAALPLTVRLNPNDNVVVAR